METLRRLRLSDSRAGDFLAVLKKGGMFTPSALEAPSKLFVDKSENFTLVVCLAFLPFLSHQEV